jgi:hypothetical protein
MKKIFLKLFSAGVILASGSAQATTHYVVVNNINATSPYTNWATASTVIQDAVYAAVAGDEILVTNGTYQDIRGGFGGNSAVLVDRPVNIRSVGGPRLTIIEPEAHAGRCVYLTNGASLSGFTLTGGQAGSGGGVYGGTLTNCIIAGNQATGSTPSQYTNIASGGGAFGCTLYNCTLSNNTVRLINPAGAILYSYGGGAAYCTLNDCVLTGNSAISPDILFGAFNYAFGGGVYQCTLNSCTLIGNWASVSNYIETASGISAYGGGAYGCTLNNCTLCGNSASAWSYDFNSDASGGGVGSCTATNCILFGNFYMGQDQAEVYYYCEDCVSPGTLNGNNCSGDPFFVDTNGWANLRLQSNSPCINAGNNAFAPTGPDLDGNPRIIGGTVDIGAYEFQSLSLINFSVVSNQAGFSITGQSNQVVTVQTSTDLLNWSPLATNTLNGHPFPFNDPTPATLPQRFYRAQAE